MRSMWRLIPVLVVPFVFAACEGSGSDPVNDQGTSDTVGQDVVDPGDPGGGDLPGDRLDTGVEDPGVPQDPGQDPGQGGDPGTDGEQPDAQDDVPVVPPCLREGDPCEDGNPCTYGETCDAELYCVGGTLYSCQDDGRPCTDDLCDGKGNCAHVLQDGKCLINGVCHDTGAVSPDDVCKVCLPSKAKAAWSRADDDNPCDATGVLETCEEAPSATCRAGVCVPDLVVDKSCDDENPCTQDSCDPELGCLHQGVTGPACILGDRCKVGLCNQGVCVIPPDASCDDGNPCTQDVCDPAIGCLWTPLNDIACDDGNECTVLETCFQGECRSSARNCDDGNVCTIDACDPVLGCYPTIIESPCCANGISKCDDDNVCTNDDCDETGENCIYSFNTAACDDRDPCTVNDTCDQGECIGVQKNCSDGNACTRDWCDKGKCMHEALTGTPCDDGLECSTGDTCQAGVCVPQDITGCLCQPTFSPAISKLVTMKIETNGQTGNALNLDELPGCAPADNCCCGLDNAMGPLAGIPAAADGIKKAMEEGKIILMFEHRSLRTDGQPYTLAFYAGKLDPANASCNFLTQTCNYIVDRSIFDEECNPLVFLDNAKISSGKLTAGGKGYTFPFDLPLMEGINLHVDLYMARVEAQVTVSGGRVTAMSGILGGAIPKQQIIDAVSAIPDNEWPSDIPIDKATVLMFLDVLVVADIDGDGDGQPESASIGIKFTAIAGNITGVY